MCLPWRCMQLIAIVIITSVVCEGQIDNSGKVYPRGNHWAVGHLMGKKSTDAQIESQEGGRRMDQPDAPSTGGRDSDRTLGPSSPFWLWFRTVLRPEPDKVSIRQTFQQVPKMLEDRGQMEEQRELQKHLKEVADLLFQASVMKQSTSS